MQNFDDGMCWDESEESAFYGDGIPEMLEKEGYDFSGATVSHTFWADDMFAETLAFIRALPEFRG